MDQMDAKTIFASSEDPTAHKLPAATPLSKKYLTRSIPATTWASEWPTPKSSFRRFPEEIRLIIVCIHNRVF